jgi:hypothetical protein
MPVRAGAQGMGVGRIWRLAGTDNRAAESRRQATKDDSEPTAGAVLTALGAVVGEEEAG